MKFEKLVLLFSLTCVVGAVSVRAAGEVPQKQSSSVFLQADASTHYRAVFAQFLAVTSVEPRVDSAISVSNVCAAPDDVSFFIGEGPDRGTVTLVLYDRDGEMFTYTTHSDVVGSGLNPDGTLGPGRTWTVRLAEVLAASQGLPESAIEDFSGYGWVLAGFDCLAGTYNNTIFGLGFTQAFEMMPAMGQGGFFGGIMIPSP